MKLFLIIRVQLNDIKFCIELITTLVKRLLFYDDLKDEDWMKS